MINNLKIKGKRLNDLGYDIVPIAAGGKFPTIKGWQNIEATPEMVDGWLANGHAKGAGVGILTKRWPAVDVDIYDEDAAAYFIEKFKDKYDVSLMRTGMAPKVLFPFRLAPGAPPMKKRKSAVHIDVYGDEHAVEILGDGQQYVANHIHPDTGQPYYWANDADLTTIAPEDLPILTPEMVDWIIDLVDEIAIKFDWELKSKASGGGTSTFISDGDFEDVKPKLGLTVDEVNDKVMAVPNEDLHYDTFIDVGMAIVHELGKTDEAYDIWNAWSQQSGKYDENKMPMRWRSFKEYRDGNAVTMATVLKLATEAEEDRKEADLERLLSTIKQADDRHTLMRQVPKQIAKFNLDKTMFEDLAVAMQGRYKQITGANLPKDEARKLCRSDVQAVKNSLDSGEFAWCDDFIFLSRDSKFFNKVTKELMSPDAFDRCHDFKLLSPEMIAGGQYIPRFRASHIAMNISQIPQCVTTMYAPGQPTVFEMASNANVQFANSYRPSNVYALKREQWSDKEHDLIKRVEKVLNAVSIDEQDKKVFRQWLSYIVQNVGCKSLTWSVVLQGAQGSGKTFWHGVMSAILGEHNTRPISTTEMENQFTGWGAGHCFGCVEEIKLHGKNKWEIVNRLKPYISNAIVPIERKGRDSLGVINTVNYLLLTNFKDALPLEDSDRRYYPIFSRLQFVEDVTNYYTNEGVNWWEELFRMLPECGDTLFGWLLETDMNGFTPSKAPTSRAKEQMIDLGRSPEEVFITDLLEDENRPDITCKLLTTKDITKAAVLHDEPLNLNTNALARVLSNLGFDKLPRMKLNGEKESPWTRDSTVTKFSSAQIRELYNAQKLAAEGIVPIDDFAPYVK